MRKIAGALSWSLVLGGCVTDPAPNDEGGDDSGSGGRAAGGQVGVVGGSGGDSALPSAGGGAVSTGGTGGDGPAAGGMSASSGGAPGQGTGGFSSNRDDFSLGADSQCPGEFTVCESFESTQPGNLPSGWSLTGYGTRTVAVTDSMSARGSRALEITVPSQSAVVGMIRLDDVGALGPAHFGRMFYRIEGPSVSEFIHFDVLEAVGPWMEHQNGVRFASTGTGVGTQASNWSWIYNVQPFDGGGAEFGSEGDRSAHPVVDEWMCLEWAFDSAEQTAIYYHDGNPISYLVIDDERSEIPVFSEIGVGFQKFQSTGALHVWVDEVALHTSRIGCNH